MDEDPEARKRLADLMNVARARQRMTWEDVAQRGGISVALLRNIRKDRAPITLDSEVAIERGLRLPDGWVRRVLTGDEVTAEERRDEPELRDDGERQIWAMDALDEDLRREYIRMYRERKQRHTKDQAAG